MDFASIVTTLKTANTYDEISKIQEEILKLIPKATIMVNFDQQNRAHQFNLWDHCVHTVLNLPRNLEDDMLYIAALLHDIGKPDCQQRGTRVNDSNMHYYGHPNRSMEIVRDAIIPGLIAQGITLTDNQQRRLIYYVENHDDRVSLKKKHLQRHLQIASFEEFQNLMLLQVADAKAHVLLPIIQKRIEICNALSGSTGKDIYHTLQEENDTT